MARSRTVVLPVGPEQAGQRLDTFLATQLPWRSRRSVVELIESGAVRLDDRPAKKSRRLLPNERVVITVPVDVAAERELAELPLDILHEDEDLVVVNKQAGLAVHPSSTSMTHNLLSRLEHHFHRVEQQPEVQPLLVHRLDRTTSGVIAVAKRRELVAFYTQQFERRTTHKTYMAIVQGKLEGHGRIEARLLVEDQKPVRVSPEGLEALTEYRVLESGDSASRVAITLHTGRKHQIRVHFAHIGHPLVNDNMYGATLNCICASGPLLHSATLTLEHRDGRTLTFVSRPPPSMEEAWASLP